MISNYLPMKKNYLVLFAIIGAWILTSTPCITSAQTNYDTAGYLPQVRLVASNGFNPFVMKSQQELVIRVSELPLGTSGTSGTSRVYFGFVDHTFAKIGPEHTVTGSNLAEAVWTVNLDTCNFPLSTQFRMEVQWSGDSIANWYIPLGNLPDTMKLGCSYGWGPYISNQYPLNDSLWNPVDPQKNTIVLKNLPPRTTKVMFYLLEGDYTIIDSVECSPLPHHDYLDSARIVNAVMTDLPLSIRFILPVAYCEGGPATGVHALHKMVLLPQPPKFFCTVNDTTHTDSIPAINQRPMGGQVAVVDNVKHGEASNRSFGWEKQRGIYSFVVATDDFTIGAWVLPDVDTINQATNGEMTFLTADSAWSISLKKASGSLQLIYYRNIRHERLDIFTATLESNSILDGNWHHIAFLNQGLGTPQKGTFYLDGQPLTTETNWNSYHMASGSSTVYLYGRPLKFGGCNALAKNSFDRSFIKRMDEIRIWNRTLLLDELQASMHDIQLQDEYLIGYWNFDDKNCRLNFFDDLSFQNNGGIFREGATLAGGEPRFSRKDTLLLISSNTQTDSVRFSFVDEDNRVIDSVTILSPGGKARLLYNLSALPFGTRLLRTHEYYQEETDSGFIHEFLMRIIPPAPKTSARNGWGNYYRRSWSNTPPSMADSGCLYNAVTVSGLPENTWKITTGLAPMGMLNHPYDTITFYNNSNPYQHSLSLDGKTNFISTSAVTEVPEAYTLMFWFRSTTKEGGIMAMFTNNIGGGPATRMNHLVAMKENGSLLYNLLLNLGNSQISLHATGQYNDGVWHHLTAVVTPFRPPYKMGKASLFIDGNIVDEKWLIKDLVTFPGHWMFGKCQDSVPPVIRDSVAAHFQGSLSEISLWNDPLDYSRINRAMYLPSLDTMQHVIHYYKLDEGSGDLVKDSKGSLNGTLEGGPQKWFTDPGLNTVTWHQDMIAGGQAGGTFFVKAWSPECDTGRTYQLGRFNLIDPIHTSDNSLFTYRFSQGLGYFDMGNSLTQMVDVKVEDQMGQHPQGYIFVYEVYGPDGHLFQMDFDTVPGPILEYSFAIELGDLPIGSFLIMDILDGYSTERIGQAWFPILIRPFVPPKIHGDFGPFIQAIAPGTMKAINTFTIKTADIDELGNIKAKFYTSKGIFIDELDAMPVGAGNETWLVTYDMAELHPPFTGMELEYYLGQNPDPVVVQGPYDITITRTRPYWFDFCKSSDFSDIKEDSINKVVTFNLRSPLEDPVSFNNDVSIVLPKDVPLLSGVLGMLFSPCMEIKLKFNIDSLKLEIDPSDTPNLYQDVIHIGAGKRKDFRIDFTKDENNSYELDADDNLFATQNFHFSAGMTTELESIAQMGEEIKEIIDIAGSMNPESAIISPSFSISYSGNFNYASRLHLKLDTIDGQSQWGSYGNLNVTAREGTPGYEESASYHFYGGSFGVEFEIGAKLLEGLVEGDFCVDMRFNAGYGHSYITLPKNDTRFLKDLCMDIHGKVVVKELWGLASQTVWGPTLFYSHRFWGDDMDDCFAEDDSGDSPLAGDFIPVSKFIKTPLAYPQASITTSANYNLFTWLEKGDSLGERHLRSRFLMNKTKKFSDKLTIHSNTHAINNPVTAGFSDSTVLISWSQSRYTGLTLSHQRSDQIIRKFAESQDVWYAVFDITTDSILQIDHIYDDLSGMTTGRAEAKPSLAVLSESLAVLVWQVANLDNHTSDLWYATLSKSSDTWIPSHPAQIVGINGIETSIFLSKTDENRAVMTCLSNPSQESATNRILTLSFDGNHWSDAVVLYEEPNHYINFLDMEFTETFGGVVISSYVTDTSRINYEVISLIPWNAVISNWMETPVKLLVDSVHHFQYPQISINNDGKSTIAVKLEKFAIKTSDQRISQIDLLSGDLSLPAGHWYHIAANSLVCDTTKQVSAISLSYVGVDTLMLLTQEYVMLPGNTPYIPVHGQTWGNPYMNQVLRCFSVIRDSIIDNVPESEYNVGIEDPMPVESEAILFQTFPNPCTTHCTVVIDLPAQTHITLQLFNMNGYLISTLADKTLQPGMYNLQVNSSLLQPGTYIYKLTTDHSILTRRMVVIR